MHRIVSMTSFCGLLGVMNLFLAGPALASGGGGGAVAFIDYYHIVLASLGLDDHEVARWAPTVGGCLCLFLVVVFGCIFKSNLERSGYDPKPVTGISVRNFVEAIAEFARNLAHETIGHGYERFVPLVTGIFFFILVCNLTGLIPGFPPATESINTNLPIGLTVFLAYNAAGFREHGLGYIKQFLGPVVWLAPLVMGIELLSHAARPFSLSIRLLGNLFGDHLMLSVFTGLTYVGVPALMLFLGLLVAVIQSFVFSLLTCIYISMAVSHDH